ncbi:MAG: hypothetical protein Q8M26_08730 [Pseudolabrys sp.]|nr:hypothetical protein [Pseudolabrys sp.]
MSTLAQVVGTLKARAAAQITMFGPRVYWDKDAVPTLPDDPEPFLFFYIDTGRPEFVAFGGGRGNNLQRTEGDLVGLVFLPRDWGLEEHASYGEHVASAFRSHRDAHVSCFATEPQPAVDGSSLKPPGLESEVVNYACVVVAVPFHYDHVG